MIDDCHVLLLDFSADDWWIGQTLPKKILSPSSSPPTNLKVVSTKSQEK